MAENYGYSNGLTYNYIIQKISDDEPYQKKRLYISQAIKKISNTDLLNNIIFKLAETGLVDFNDEVVLKFRKELAERNYTEDINTKIRADFLSVFLDYDTKANYFQNVTKQEKPKLNIKVRRKQLFDNYDDVSKYMKRQMVLFKEKEISKLPPEQQENDYKKLIRQTSLFHFGKDFKEFEEELELFKILKENIVTNNTQTKKVKINPKLEHPFIVLNAKELFLEYTSKYIIEPYVDYSYLFQRMLLEKFITRLTHVQFMNWLIENKHITKKVQDDLLKKGSFRSLDKCASSNRENNFNIVFKSILYSS